MSAPQVEELWSRRIFLKTSLAGLALLGGQLFLPGISRSSSFPEGRLRLHNTHTGERLTVKYRSSSGRYDREALQDIDRLFRCSQSNKVHRIDIRLLEFLNKIEKTVAQGKEIHIHSGYRSLAFNKRLVIHEKGAVPNSFHTKGKALDLSIPGVRLSSVRRAAQTLHLGGVGNYSRRGFIHIDTGPPRYW